MSPLSRRHRRRVLQRPALACKAHGVPQGQHCELCEDQLALWSTETQTRKDVSTHTHTV
jgi:hypothetical protein